MIDVSIPVPVQANWPRREAQRKFNPVFNCRTVQVTKKGRGTTKFCKLLKISELRFCHVPRWYIFSAMGITTKL
jgi:hypothetical protein